MRSKIIQFLKTDRSFETGLRLYMEHGPSESFKRILNRQGFSDYNHKLLLEELRKAAGIPNDEFNFILSQKVEKSAVMQIIKEDEPVTREQVTGFIGGLPDFVRKSIKLRDEFPFLREKTCPDELKLLVADMMTAYDTYMQSHEKLFAATTPEDFAAAAADVVENYLENREIWDELNYYKEHASLLGKHPIFEQMERFKEIRAMKVDSLVKLLKSLENNISRNKKKIEDEPEHPETFNRKQRVEAYVIELTEVKRLIELK